MDLLPVHGPPAKPVDIPAHGTIIPAPLTSSSTFDRLGGGAIPPPGFPLKLTSQPLWALHLFCCYEGSPLRIYIDQDRLSTEYSRRSQQLQLW